MDPISSPDPRLSPPSSPRSSTSPSPASSPSTYARSIGSSPVLPGVDPDQYDGPSSTARQVRPTCASTPLKYGCEDHWSWNKNDKSHEVRLYGPKQRIAHFHPNWSNGTAGVRGTRILNGGRFYWEINVSQRFVYFYVISLMSTYLHKIFKTKFKLEIKNYQFKKKPAKNRQIE